MEDVLLRSGVAFYGMPKYATIGRIDYEGEDGFIDGFSKFINVCASIVDLPIYILKMGIAVIESVMFMLNFENDDEYYSGNTRNFRCFNSRWFVHIKSEKGLVEGNVPEIEVYYDGEKNNGIYYYYLEDYKGHKQGDFMRVGTTNLRRWGSGPNASFKDYVDGIFNRYLD